MQLFGNTIRRQLTLVVLCTSLVGLGIVYATFEFYVRASFRRTLTGELSVLADSVAANSHVPLAFHDEKWAEDVLGELGAERRVVAACLYSSDGKILAEYRRAGIDSDFHIPYSENDGARFTAESLTFHRTIFFKGAKLGSISIISDLTELQVRMREYLEISVLALFLSIVTTVLLSSRLLRLITEPILQLAEVAGKVSTEENYALRAIPQSNDEVGKLIHSFNRMLERIQERDTELKEINDELELRVEARTKELQLEVEERMCAQETLSAERQILRALIDNVPDYMYVKDTDCRFLLANLAVARQMGAKSSEELIGKTDFDFYPRELTTTFFEDEQRVIRGGKAETNREEAGMDPQGNLSHVLTTQVPLRGKNGQVIGLVGIGHDITHLKRIQAEMSNVVADSHEANDLAVLAPEGHLRGQNVAKIALRIHACLFAVRLGFPPADHSLLIFEECSGELTRIEIEIGLSDQLLRTLRAHLPRNGQIGQQEPAVRVLHVHVVRDVIDQGAQDLSFRGKCFLRAHSLLNLQLQLLRSRLYA